jgi:hypothetical protein
VYLRLLLQQLFVELGREKNEDFMNRKFVVIVFFV